MVDLLRFKVGFLFFGSRDFCRDVDGVAGDVKERDDTEDDDGENGAG